MNRLRKTDRAEEQVGETKRQILIVIVVKFQTCNLGGRQDNWRDYHKHHAFCAAFFAIVHNIEYISNFPDQAS